ncbi:MAG: hypothetical protein WA695_01265 [Candidatus Dormiibacterota bacterium]
MTHDQLWRDVETRLADERAKIQGVKFTLHFVPPGGGGQEFSADVVDAQRVPTVGEYLHVTRDGAAGADFFRVLQVGANYRESSYKEHEYTEGGISVVAEYIEGPQGYMSEEHRGLIEAYKRNGLEVHKEPPWGY